MVDDVRHQWSVKIQSFLSRERHFRPEWRDSFSLSFQIHVPTSVEQNDILKSVFPSCWSMVFWLRICLLFTLQISFGICSIAIFDEWSDGPQVPNFSSRPWSDFSGEFRSRNLPTKSNPVWNLILKCLSQDQTSQKSKLHFGTFFFFFSPKFTRSFNLNCLTLSTDWMS